ncbi:MAG: hypothetical protein ACLUPK_01885 [Veillonella sp.]
MINVENTNIHTKGDSSRGLDATYKGNCKRQKPNYHHRRCSLRHPCYRPRRRHYQLQKQLSLRHSGTGSPVIYSTGNITVNNVNGTANKSEIGVVEGKNSITLTNSNVTGYHDNGFHAIPKLLR